MRVIVVVPNGAESAAGDVAAEVRRYLDADPGFVWAGDPHLRPTPPDGGAWIDAGPHWLGCPSGIARLSVPVPLVGLLHAAVVLAGDPRDDAPALVLDAGCAVLLGSVVLPERGVGVVERRLLADDAAVPGFAELVEHGPYGVAALSIRPSDAALVASRVLVGGPDGTPGCLLAAALSGLTTEPLPAEVVGWARAAADPPALLDTVHVDRAEPWRLAFEQRPSVLLSEREDLRAALRVAPEPSPQRLPGAVPVDDTMRRLVAANLRAYRRGAEPLAPDPWAAPSAFLRWLATPANPWDPAIGRYWNALWHARADLSATFPDPAGRDLVAFRRWADRRFRWEGHSPLVRSLAGPAATWGDVGRDPGGVDLIGYFGSEVSLASVTDRIRAGLDAVGIPYRTVDFRRTGSPRRSGVVTDDELAHRNVIAVVNPDQVPALLAEHGDVLAGRRLFGFWHWDVEHVPADVVDAMSSFEQIWVLNEFTERSLAVASSSTPVRSLPLPVACPEPSSADRAALGLPHDRFVVLVTFDHLSLTERKNPIGAIEAFRRAFPEPSDEGPVLVVKSMNADQRWASHERVRLAALGRPDIVVVDRMLTRADQMALVRHADVMLSLHRSEGLGLHLVEAMWLGTPTIATRYSGNLSFMDDSNSLLVDAALVPVEHAEGFYPPGARWADPDLDQAADHLRRLVGDADLRERLVVAGRARVGQQPDFIETGRSIAAWCGIEVR